ncbi:MAG: KpsF/GutQ family sugar-phosphate isomerase [Phycisphaeraceae bacterium]|nr:KpsF/GutQ family sugar-phosphate isomerase [Phycisphaeraceae bacterium]
MGESPNGKHRTKSPARRSGRPPAGRRGDLAFAAEVLRAESRAVGGLVRRLGPEFQAAVDAVVRCADADGTVLVTGLGKSGHIAQKISATLKSLGIPSHFVHPTEAAHGDLGSFRRQDVCVALSYSGETEEVVALAAILKQDGIPILAITSGHQRGARRDASGLERVATHVLAIGAVEETEKISPAPACSTTAMLALGDALALVASRRRNFTVDDFAKRHPGGSLGGLLRPVLGALRFEVGKNVEPVPDDVSVAEALELADGAVRRPGALLLVNRKTGVLTGIFTDGDLRRLVRNDPADLRRPVRDLMTRSPRTLPHTALVKDAVRLMREFRSDEVPVVDTRGRPVGILDVQDLMAMKVVSG